METGNGKRLIPDSDNRRKENPNSEIMLLGFGLFEHTYARIAGYLTYISLGKAIYGQWLCLILWMFLLVGYILKRIHDRSSTRIVLGMTLFSVFLGMMYLLFPATQKYYSEYFPEIVTLVVLGIPCAIIICMVRDLNSMVVSFRPFLRIGTILCIIGILLGIRISYLSSMGWGITVMPLALFYYGHNRIVNRSSEMVLFRTDKILGIIAVLFTLLGGRQWPVIVFCGILYCSVWQADSKRQRIFRVFLGGVLIVLIILTYDYLLKALQYAINSIGINSRALSSIVNGNLLDTYNRKSIYGYCQEIIKNNGFRISGLFADRYYLRQYRSNIAYAHNFFYEILIDFGTLFGGSLLVVFAILVVRSFIICRKELRIPFVLVFCYGFLRFLVSSSFIIEINLVVLLGLLLNKNLRIQERMK